MAKENKSNIIIYQSENGQTHIEVQMDKDTVWLSQQQMADLYQTSRTNVVEHIKHIYEDGELVEESTVGKSGRLSSTGEVLLMDAGMISHEQAMDKAETEYRKWEVRTLSPVEQAYLNSIKTLNHKTKKKG